MTGRSFGAPQRHVQFFQRGGKIFQIFFGAAVTKINVIGYPRAAEDVLGLAADDDELNMMPLQERGDPFKLCFAQFFGRWPLSIKHRSLRDRLNGAVLSGFCLDYPGSTKDPRRSRPARRTRAGPASS